jgi:hypothetical protein
MDVLLRNQLPRWDGSGEKKGCVDYREKEEKWEPGQNNILVYIYIYG